MLRAIQEIDFCNILICLDCICLMVINATFTNISVISWRSVLFVEETGGLGENHLALIEIRTHNILGDSGDRH